MNQFQSNSFSYSKDQVTHLAGWYSVNTKYGRGFSVAMTYAVNSPDEKTPPIWPDATLGIVGQIAELVEKIHRVDSGESKFWWHSLPKKTGSPNESIYISYRAENWIREGLGLPIDPELNKPVKFKPDYTLNLRDTEGIQPCPPPP